MPTVQEIANLIEQKSLVDVASLPRKMRVVWFPKMNAQEVALLYPLADSDAKRQEMISSVYPTIWLREGPVPFNADMLIFEMFEDDAEYRIYAAPKADAKPRPGPTGRTMPVAPQVYRLSKHSSLLSQDALSYDMFISLIAEEWAMVDEGISTIDRECAMIVQHIEAQGPEYTMAKLLEDLREGVHREDDEEEDEEDDDDEEEPEAAPASPDTPPALPPEAVPAAT